MTDHFFIDEILAFVHEYRSDLRLGYDVPYTDHAI